MSTETIRQTARFSTLEMDAYFREAAATVGIPIDELRRANSLPIDFFYALLSITTEKSIGVERQACAALLDISNYQIRQLAREGHAPQKGVLQRQAGPTELTPQDIRLVQTILKNRSDAIKARET